MKIFKNAGNIQFLSKFATKSRERYTSVPPVKNTPTLKGGCRGAVDLTLVSRSFGRSGDERLKRPLLPFLCDSDPTLLPLPPSLPAPCLTLVVHKFRSWKT